MDMTALLLSRIQFAFTITFHIIFPSLRSGWQPGSLSWRLWALRPAGRSIACSKFWLNIRCFIRAHCIRDRDGIPVRHELERAVKMSGPIGVRSDV
jgi:hypothetical protein